MKIAILTPNDTHLAETFIQNHITYIQHDKIVIHGDKYPYLLENEKLSFIKFQLFKIGKKFRTLFGLDEITYREYKLTKILKKYRIQVVLAEYLITAAETQHVCRKLNIPMVAIALGYDISQHKILSLYHKKYKSLFQYASYIVVVSNHMRRNLFSLDCPKEKIVYSPASASLDFFEIEPKFDNEQILSVGRFVEKKAPHLTIYAFSEVLISRPNAILVMAGDGPLLEDCKALVVKLNISKSVVFTGKISREIHKSLLVNSLIFVQHSITADDGDSEGTPVAILEASAAGLPVVATHHAGIPEVIIHGQTGLLCEESDVGMMSQHMLSILNDIDFGKQLGTAGKEHVKTNFALERHIQTLQEVLELALKTE